jgi:outer membrane murein-binding lipoprotein Lpp
MMNRFGFLWGLKYSGLVVVVALLGCTTFAGCGPSSEAYAAAVGRAEYLEDENDRLKAEVEELRAALEEANEQIRMAQEQIDYVRSASDDDCRTLQDASMYLDDVDEIPEP